MEQIKKEISGKPVSIILDGTSRLGEALLIVLRFLELGNETKACSTTNI